MTADDDWLAPRFREVASPLRSQMLRPLDPRCGTVQFESALSDADYRTLADFLGAYPDVELRAYGSYDGSIRDLEFLRFFPSLRRFSADALYDSLESFEGLRHLPDDVHSLGLGATRRRLSLQPLRRFTGLRSLYLDSQTKDLDVVGELRSLINLTLRSITLPDLSLLLPLTGLRALDVKLGGTRDVALLPRIGALEYLELYLVRGLTDLRAVSEVASLRFLFLQALRNVTALPDLSRLSRLEGVHLETMKGITDLAPLLTAPALREASLVGMGHLQPADVGVLADHPTLRFLTAGLNSIKKNRAAEALVPLPRNEEPWDLSVLLGEI